MRCVRSVVARPSPPQRRAFATQPASSSSAKRSQRLQLKPIQQQLSRSTSARGPRRGQKGTGGHASPPSPFVIIGSQTILQTLQTNPTSVDEIIIDQEKLRNRRITSIAQLAAESGITLKHATKEHVNSLSKNPRQDQGIIAKVKPLQIVPLEEYLNEIKFGPSALVALDSVTNPQNIGMMLRSFAAGDYINGVIIPRHSCPPASHPLVIKASAGTVLHSKVKILDCLTVEEAILKCNLMGYSIVGLDQRGSSNIFEYSPPSRVVYVIGNESQGINARMKSLLTKRIKIPMAENVDSLNVAVAASFIGYVKHFRAASTAALAFRPGVRGGTQTKK